MTLSETIEYHEKKAKELERSAKLHQRPNKDVKGNGKRYLSCLECAKEHKQLAEWLKELKAYKELDTYNRSDKCSECEFEDSAYYCEDCIWNYINKFMQREVNADD